MLWRIFLVTVLIFLLGWFPSTVGLSYAAVKTWLYFPGPGMFLLGVSDVLRYIFLELATAKSLTTLFLPLSTSFQTVCLGLFLHDLFHQVGPMCVL